MNKVRAHMLFPSILRSFFDVASLSLGFCLEHPSNEVISVAINALQETVLTPVVFSTLTDTTLLHDILIALTSVLRHAVNCSSRVMVPRNPQSSSLPAWQIAAAAASSPLEQWLLMVSSTLMMLRELCTLTHSRIPRTDSLMLIELLRQLCSVETRAFFEQSLQSKNPSVQKEFWSLVSLLRPLELEDGCSGIQAEFDEVWNALIDIYVDCACGDSKNQVFDPSSLTAYLTTSFAQSALTGLQDLFTVLPNRVYVPKLPDCFVALRKVFTFATSSEIFLSKCSSFCVQVINTISSVLRTSLPVISYLVHIDRESHKNTFDYNIDSLWSQIERFVFDGLATLLSLSKSQQGCDSASLCENLTLELLRLTVTSVLPSSLFASQEFKVACVDLLSNWTFKCKNGASKILSTPSISNFCMQSMFELCHYAKSDATIVAPSPVSDVSAPPPPPAAAAVAETMGNILVVSRLAISQIAAPFLIQNCNSMLATSLESGDETGLNLLFESLISLELHPAVTSALIPLPFSNRSTASSKGHLFRLFPVLCDCIRIRSDFLREKVSILFRLVSTELGFNALQ